MGPMSYRLLYLAIRRGEGNLSLLVTAGTAALYKSHRDLRSGWILCRRFARGFFGGRSHIPDAAGGQAHLPQQP